MLQTRHGWLIGRGVFIAALLVIAGFLYSVLVGGQRIIIDTDIKDLSPDVSAQRDAQQAIDQLAGFIEQRFILLLASQDPEQLAAASKMLIEQLRDIPGLEFPQESASAQQQLVEQLTPYRFHLLTSAQRTQLQALDDAALLAAAGEALYGMQGMFRLLPLHQDPLGWFGEYLLERLEQLGISPLANDSPANTSSALEQWHYRPIVVVIGQGALEFERQRSILARLATLEEPLDQGIQIDHSGIFFIAAEAAATAKKDLSLISIGSTIGVVILLLVAFRSLLPLLLPILSIMLGVGFAFSVVHAVYGSVHILTIVFGAGLIGIVIDYSLHYFYHNASIPGSTERASKVDQRALHNALLFSLITSLIGYGALGLTDLVAMEKIALFSCCGLFMAWLTVVAAAPVFLRRPVETNKFFIPLLTRAIDTFAARLLTPWAAALFVALVIAAALILPFALTSSDNPKVFFTLSETLLAEERRVSERVSDIEPGRYFLIRGRQTVTIYQRLQALYQRVSEPEALVSIADWLPGPLQQQQNYALQQRIYQPQGVAKQFFDSLGLGPPVAAELSSEYTAAAGVTLEPETLQAALGATSPPLWLTEQDTLFSFVLIRKHYSTKEFAQIAQELDGVDYINTLAVTQTVLHEQRRAASEALVLAFLLISGLVLLRYRRLEVLWMVAIPLGGTLITLVIFALSGVAVTIFHTMAMFLVLGLGMDYVIFARDLDDDRLLTLQAILLSALTSLLSFGLLSVSSIPVVQAFGLTVLIGNTFNLLATVVFSQIPFKSLRRQNGIE